MVNLISLIPLMIILSQVHIPRNHIKNFFHFYQFLKNQNLMGVFT